MTFSLDKLRQHVDSLDTFVKAAALNTIKQDMGPKNLGGSSVAVDKPVHLHGLLDLMRGCIQKIENAVAAPEVP